MRPTRDCPSLRGLGEFQRLRLAACRAWHSSACCRLRSRAAACIAWFSRSCFGDSPQPGRPSGKTIRGRSSSLAEICRIKPAFKLPLVCVPLGLAPSTEPTTYLIVRRRPNGAEHQRGPETDWHFVSIRAHPNGQVYRGECCDRPFS